jgi:dihydrofolate reductase
MQENRYKGRRDEMTLANGKALRSTHNSKLLRRTKRKNQRAWVGGKIREVFLYLFYYDEMQMRRYLFMSKIIVFTNLTLDGVMQAPAGPDEDRRGGFDHGGWAAPYNAMAQTGESLPTINALLLGRRTYESFYAVWPKRKDNPYSARLDAMQKYVASTTLSEPLAWINSTLLKGDAAQTVARLKQEQDRDLVIMGSGELARSLMRANLIDEYVLLIHPLVLGSGRRLFPKGAPLAPLRLIGVRTTSNGIVIATYQPA